MTLFRSLESNPTFSLHDINPRFNFSLRIHARDGSSGLYPVSD